jgi:hypothetical protein
MNNYWFNFDAQEYDYIATPKTEGEMMPYIPNQPAARSLFSLYILEGDEPVTACVKVLELIVKKRR